MQKSLKKSGAKKVNLSNYAEKILSNEDLPLFDDAVEAAKAGVLRAAYLLIWLACAESLKRRFREASMRDRAASRIVRSVEEKERDHKAVDKLVLDKAKEYGFLSDSSHTVLNHIYVMRCLYGHPYEESPTMEQVSHAASAVVEHVLSQPVKLRHGFGEQLFGYLSGELNYLDDQRAAVEAFVKEILPKIDESIYGWILEKYWKNLEAIADDPSLSIFFRRGIWFSKAMLLEVGVSRFTEEEWHSHVIEFPKLLMFVCCDEEVFGYIGERAQDSLVSSILERSGVHANVLKILERLHGGKVLSGRQEERFFEQVSKMEIDEIRSASLSTVTSFGNLISAMKTLTWPMQNPAIDLVVSNGPAQAAELDNDQQIELGRNILQCAEGGANSAKFFLGEISKDASIWPVELLRGISLELFTNEKNQIRYKIRYLDRVLSALESLGSKERNQIASEIAASINVGVPRFWMNSEDTSSLITLLKSYGWAIDIVKALQEKSEQVANDKKNLFPL